MGDRREVRARQGAAVIAAVALLLAACAGSPVRQAESYAAQDQWLKAVLEYRRAYNENPEDIELRSRLQQTELRAADYYYQRGLELEEQGNMDAAIAKYQQGLVAKPDHAKLRQAMKAILARREADRLYREALRNREIGRTDDARRLFEQALETYPDHRDAARVLQALTEERERARSEGLALAARDPITLEFRRTPLKRAFEYVTEAFGINVIFDEDIEDAPVTLFAQDVTFRQALNLMLTTTSTFHKVVGRNTILVAPDTDEKRGQYEDQIIRTFHLKVIKAKRMADLLKGVLALKKLIVNEELNTLMIRDTDEVIRLCERLIGWNDRRPAELVLDVEILEVNRSKAEQLGLDFGSQLSVSFPEFTVSGSWRDALDQGTVTLPTVVFRYFKQDVDAKTLANPKVRVVNNRSATIHIGDRIPLRTSTILDATGQVRTTFEYRDIGIKLEVLPDIHLDNSVTVDLHLEVSTLGQNLGTVDEPAFSIGTRNADTFMLLRDGETAILGGLIRDEERSSRIKLPGLGDLPVIGRVFTQNDDSSGRTDVLLTITPRVVRGWRVPPKESRAMFSGTEGRYALEPVFAYLRERPAGGAAPRIRLEPAAAGEAPPAAARPAGAGAAVSGETPQPSGRQPRLRFDQALYTLASGQEAIVEVRARGLGGAGALPIELLFNPNILEVGGVERGDLPMGGFDAQVESAKGVVRLELSDVEAVAGAQERTIARLKVRGVKPGISYLVYRTSNLVTGEGDAVKAQVRASRVKVQ
ncbi:MAG: hypothetical protein GWN84_13920 [Gammaproteobacteria bacterium]|nr:hypothetical protein [Gammaproteobacteria bacterium]NIR58692.1 hypothetical protein [Gammaproteobacteria bacterium]NIR90353.1 hypothetical protein [Gammaproteobacteria bacterium]